MTEDELLNGLQNAYKQLDVCIEAQARAKMVKLDRETALAERRTQLIIENKIEGSNAEARKASLDFLLERENSLLYLATLVLITTESEFERAYRQVRKWQDMLNLTRIQNELHPDR